LKRNFGLADLPPEQVWLTVYGSGGRLIKKINSENFGHHFFGSFDRLKRDESIPEPIEPQFTSTNLNPYDWKG
jgi:hypothetical protein